MRSISGIHPPRLPAVLPCWLSSIPLDQEGMASVDSAVAPFVAAWCSAKSWRDNLDIDRTGLLDRASEAKLTSEKLFGAESGRAGSCRF